MAELEHLRDALVGGSEAKDAAANLERMHRQLGFDTRGARIRRSKVLPDGDTDDPGEQRADLAGRSDWLGVNYYYRTRVQSLGRSLSGFARLPAAPPVQPRRPRRPPCPTTCSDGGREICL